MFNATEYKSLYARFMGPLAQNVILLVNNGSGFDSYPGVSAHVSKYKATDLVPGGSIQLGDVRLIILQDDIPVGIDKLEVKDRIEVNGRPLAVINWDANTRSVGDQTIAIEVAVRG